MDGTLSSEYGSTNETDRLYQKQSRTASTSNERYGPILDAMNITIDKTATLIALTKASKRIWGKDREFIIALIGQIATNGKRNSNATESNRQRASSS